MDYVGLFLVGDIEDEIRVLELEGILDESEHYSFYFFIFYYVFYLNVLEVFFGNWSAYQELKESFTYISFVFGWILVV
jgi:hypothetical protein